MIVVLNQFCPQVKSYVECNSCLSSVWSQRNRMNCRVFFLKEIFTLIVWRLWLSIKTLKKKTTWEDRSNQEAPLTLKSCVDLVEKTIYRLYINFPVKKN